MSTRALAAVASILGLLLVVSSLLFLHKKGFTSSSSSSDLVFVNQTLLAKRGERVVLRPVSVPAPSRRYWAATYLTEPENDDVILAYPHLRAAVERSQRDSDQWVFAPPVRALALARLGALREDEFLGDIRQVVEKGPDGDRRLVCATFGDMQGASVAYYFDPERPTPLFGWERRERRATDQPLEVILAFDGGFRELPTKEAAKKSD